MNHKQVQKKSKSEPMITRHPSRALPLWAGSIMIAMSLLFLPEFVKSDTPPSLLLSQVPLELSVTTRPKVLIAIGNSQSMDGTLSGAIMVGSGALPSSFSSLQNSSSPVNYTVPAGFKPPMQAANASGQAPYTVNLNGTLYDNSASRLNVAKAGVEAIIKSYMQNTDFALAVYNTSGIGLYNTWVYYMSPNSGNFIYTNTTNNGTRYVTNPCFNHQTGSSGLTTTCPSILTAPGSSLSNRSNQFMEISASSDDPNINDVLYAGTLPGLFVTFGTVTPANPFPPNYSLANYNAGGVVMRYSNTLTSFGSFQSYATNAGYVPYSAQVYYARRGFGYGSNQSPNSGRVIVPMTSIGETPTKAALNTAINRFLPFLKAETNSTTSTEIKGLAGQSPLAGILTTARTYLTGLPSTGCKPKLYVILISDGLPTLDLTGKAWPPLGSVSSAGYGVTATFNADGSLNKTNNQALTDTISALTTLNTAGIKTYVVGLGAGVDPTLNPMAASTLTAMAIAGGTVEYYPATDPESLVKDLNNILISVQNASLSTTAAAISSTNLQIGTVEFQASFTSSDSKYQDWTGDLLQIALDPQTGSPTGTVYWSAQTLLDRNTSRKIVTWDPFFDEGVGAGVPMQWASLNPQLQALLQPSDELGAARLEYLRGNTTKEVRNGGEFRNRTHLLGDITKSKPIYVGAPSSSFLHASAGYRSFVQANVNRQAMVYVGANDGMLHAFNASTGQEQFAFIPHAVFPNLINLTEPLYNQNHMYFVDGSPTSQDVQFSDNSWHTILVGGENGGGNSIYALDITNPMNISTEDNFAKKVLWEYTEADLGLTYSQPTIGQINYNNTDQLKFAVFFGNGYNSPGNKAVFYAVNPENGDLIRKIDLCAAAPSACDTTKPQGLSSIALGQIDGIQGQAMTNAYAGDLQGNLWAINISNSDPALWTAKVLFQAKDANGQSQSITTVPLVTLNPSYPRFPGLFVMFGTGQLLIQNDLSSLATQSVYGIWDKPELSFTLQRLNLQTQRLSLVTPATTGLLRTILTSTVNPVPWNTIYGWYTDLPTSGQRTITNPQLINGSFITTLNTPPASACGIPTSMFLDIYYATGGAYVNRTQLDINNTGTINTADTYNGNNPVGISLGTGYASSPASVGINSNNYMVQIVTMSGGEQVSVINTNNGTRQTGWWQIK